MRHEHIQYLVCPHCSGSLELQHPHYEGDSIESGELYCAHCHCVYEIVRHIPRFVPETNYAASFGFEWITHSHTQYDSYTGTHISEERFFKETLWPRHLHGQTILEVGCGSGRFTEQAAATGAVVVSMDLSCAVDANYFYNGHKDNVCIVQADIYSMPFPKDFFDNLFCFGVLQHTPDVERAFLNLPQYIKKGGSLVADFYRYEWWRYFLVTRYWIRPFTKKLPPERLYKLCASYINFVWPLARLVNKLPKGRYLNRALLISDHGGVLPLSDELLREWAILETFDGLSPAYDNPQTIETVEKWFKKGGLTNIDVAYGYNGIVGRGKKW